MNTPVCDFVSAYAGENPARLHMPGHKGRAGTGPERFDITEIEGADELYHARGVIRESEENAARLFGAARTVYSAEGSSLAIRGMLYLALLSAKEKGIRPRLAAGRNAHRTFMTAAALLDLEVDWIEPGRTDWDRPPACLRDCMGVYLTSPGYLGNREDIAGAAEACRKHGVPLLVDNAHGAYLRFLEKDEHPLSLGADACCDSAHKTLPCLTGAAYLHIGKNAPARWAEQAEGALEMFGSTSPSWLILQSLDRANALLAGTYPERIRRAAARTADMKERLARDGWTFAGDEPMKLTLRAADRGWSGTGLAAELRKRGVVCEFADPEYVVLMPSAETTGEEWRRLEQALKECGEGNGNGSFPTFSMTPGRHEQVMSIREAMLSPGPVVPVEEAVGKVMADAAAACPPAVPIVAAGERITEEDVSIMRAYGISQCRVVGK